MARYRYAGPGPQEDGDGGIARPGDVREFADEPAWGPWEPLPDEDGGAVSDSPAPATPAPAPAAVSPAAASPAPAAAFGTESAPEGK